MILIDLKALPMAIPANGGSQMVPILVRLEPDLKLLHRSKNPADAVTKIGSAESTIS